MPTVRDDADVLRLRHEALANRADLPIFGVRDHVMVVKTVADPTGVYGRGGPHTFFPCQIQGIEVSPAEVPGATVTFTAEPDSPVYFILNLGSASPPVNTDGIIIDDWDGVPVMVFHG